MILFPLGNPIFEGLGPDGISMFYVSCIVSQLTYSLGGSIFKGAIGSEMVITPTSITKPMLMKRRLRWFHSFTRWHSLFLLE